MGESKISILFFSIYMKWCTNILHLMFRVLESEQKCLDDRLCIDITFVGRTYSKRVTTWQVSKTRSEIVYYTTKIKPLHLPQLDAAFENCLRNYAVDNSTCTVRKTR